MDVSAPESPMLGSEVCLNLNLHHDGAAGFAPYVRVLLPDALNGSELTATFFGDDIYSFTFGGTVSGGVVGDPLLADELPENDVYGPEGYRLYTLALPIGSMVDEGVDVPVKICVPMSGSASVDVPFDVIVQSAYRLGDEPTGLNGPLIFSSETVTITPKGYTFSMSASATSGPVGPCWQTDILMVSDVATGYSLQDVGFTMELPTDYTFQAISAVTPGCVVASAPNSGSVGGTIELTCDNVFGTESGADVQLVASGYFGDVMDGLSCSPQNSSATGEMGINGVMDQDGEVSFTLQHFSMAAFTQAASLGLNASASVGFEYKVQAYADLEDPVFRVILPDAVSYAGTALLNMDPVVASTITDLGGGQTELIFNLDASEFDACAAGFFSIDVQIGTQDFNGDMLHVGSSLGITGELTYDLSTGASGCVAPYTNGLGIPSGDVLKEMVSTPADGNAYAPGEMVTYQLSMTLPPGRTSGLVFEDIFPIPIHDVDDLSLTFGESVYLSPLDDAGLTVTNVSIDSGTNKLFIEWGADESLVERTVAVMIDIPVADVAFSGSLSHLNFGRFYSTVGDGSVNNSLSKVSLEVGSSSLSIVKGISGSDNFGVVYSPSTFPINAGANGVDSYDWIDFVITLTNGGNAPAYDVIVNDFPPYPFLTGCFVEGVEDEVGNPVAFSGSLFESGLLIPEIGTQASDPDANRIFINYKCQVEGGALSRNQHVNSAEATWAAVPGGVDRFDPIEDQCQINIRRPSIETEILDVLPGYKGNLEEVMIGEVVVMHVAITFPEGTTRDATYELSLPDGLAFEALKNHTADEGVFGYTAGNLNDIVEAVETASIGEQDAEQLREVSLSFGDVLNIASDNADPEQVEFDIWCVVTNSEPIVSNSNLNVSSDLVYRKGSNGSITQEVSNVEMEVREAELTSVFTLSNENPGPGDATLATITVDHNSSSLATAYDVKITQDLPLGMVIDETSFLTECESLIQIEPDYELGLITIVWDSIPLGVGCQLAFEATIDEAYPPCTTIETCSELTWKSASQSDLDQIDYGPLGPISYPRTGLITDPGNSSNDYTIESCIQLDIEGSDLSTPLLTGTLNVCEGEVLELSTQSYGESVSFEWFGPAVPNGYSEPTLTLSNVEENFEGAYYVSVREGECGSQASEPVAVTIRQHPTVVLQDVSLECTNGTENLFLQPIIGNNNGGLSYTWTGPQGYVSADPEALVPNVTSANQGSYQLIVTDQYGCSSELANAVLEVTDASPAPSIIAEAEICEGETANLSCSAYPGEVTYVWQLPNGTQQATSLPQLEIDETNVADDGAYTVMAQLPDCPTLWSSPVQLDVVIPPALPDIQGAQNELCEGDLLTLNTTVQADSYSWTGPNGFQSNLASPPVIQQLDSLWSGTYALSVANAGCWSDMNEFEMTVVARPDAPLVDSNAPICSGESLILSADLTASAYEWILADGSEITSFDAEWIIDDADPSMSGNYQVRIYDGSCWSEESLILNAVIDEIPNVQALTDDVIIACPEEAVQVSSLNDESLSGEWTTNEELTITTPTNSSTGILGVQQGGEYLITWNLSNDGCGIYSSSEMIIRSPDAALTEDDVYDVVQETTVDFYVLENDPFFDLPTFIEILNAPDHGTANAFSEEFVEYRPEVGYAGPDEFIYQRCLVDCPSLCSQALVKIEVVPTLGIPDIITPNGDGVNDALRIEGLDRFPNNELIIYNRWGSEVFGMAPYDNSWQGTFNGKRLPSGTYFYVFTDKERNQVLEQGYLTIQ